jgi:hypothetical protein
MPGGTPLAFPKNVVSTVIIALKIRELPLKNNTLSLQYMGLVLTSEMFCVKHTVKIIFCFFQYLKNQ